jgi:universal stress protein A
MISTSEEEPSKVSSRPARPARSRVPFGVRHILVAMGSDEKAPRAVEYAKRFARLCHGKLTLMSVYRVKYSFELLHGLEAVRSMEQEMDQAFQDLESLTTQVRQGFQECDAYFRAGIPDDEISWAVNALGIDLIVIGKRCGQSTQYKSDGIKAGTIMQRAGCPVIVIQEDGRHQ